jgi:hypothetical protein
MEQSEIEDVRRRVQAQAAGCFPEGAVQEVALLQYGDDPMVEPGQLIVRLVIPAGDRADAGGATDALDKFKHAHQAAMERFRDAISRELPETGFIEVIAGAGEEHQGQLRTFIGRPLPQRGGDLTPVMARLGTTDLETLDTLITTGIAASRADAVRWALARIRERPAYPELRERARQIEELKAQF